MLASLALLAALFIPFTNNTKTTDSSSAQQQAPTEKITRYQSVPIIDQNERGLLSELFGEDEIEAVAVAPYQVRPVIPHTITEYQKATGNWFGSRDFLEQHGIGFGTTYTSLFIGNPVGGISPGGSAYMDNFALTCIIGTEKFCGLQGGHLAMSAMQQDGGPTQNLSGRHVGAQFGVNGLVGGETMKWIELSYDQILVTNVADIKFGRVCAMDEFDVTPIYWNYIGSMRAVPLNMKTTWSPNASWGTRLKVSINHSSDIRVGVYQITQASLNGLNWNFYPSDSACLFAQYNWNPEFFKPGTSSVFENTPPDHKEVTEPSDKKALSDKSVKTPLDASRLKGLPTHFFAGGYYTSSGTHQLTSNTYVPYAYAFYFHADQMIYRPNPISNAGLTLWSAFAYAPDQNENISLITFQAKGGAIYNGLIPGRPADASIFGAGYGSFSSSYASLLESQGKGDPTYEMIYELGYRINLTKFFYLQPDLQWIINPGGTGRTPNALVLGALTSIVF